MYGDDVNDNGQKLISYDNDGNVNVCALNDSCWWYLYMYCKTKDLEVKTYARDKVSECSSHNIFCKHFL